MFTWYNQREWRTTMEVIIKAGMLFLNMVYTLMKLLPQQKKITVLSRQSNTPSMDILMLRDKITELHPDYKVVVLCRMIEGGIIRKAAYLFHILRQMYHLATSEAVILDTYCIAVSILKHRVTLLVIQMWHSIGTMKKFGYSILDKEEGSSSRLAKLMKMHANYDYILAAGDGYKNHLADGFQYPLEKIITLPLPRVERLKDPAYADKVSSAILNVYPQLKDKNKRNILYVPTFRKSDDTGLMDALKALCLNFDYERYNLIVKVHPLTDLNGFDDENAIIDIRFSSFDMLFVCDDVISDYSCIMYEAAVLKKPIFLYAYDYDDYMATRDIYMDYKAEVPGPICYTADALMDSLNRNTYDYGKLDRFLNKYVYTGSPHETQDIVNFIFQQKNARG